MKSDITMASEKMDEVRRARKRLAALCSPSGFRFLHAWTDIRRGDELQRMSILSLVQAGFSEDKAAAFLDKRPTQATESEDGVANSWPKNLSSLSSLDPDKVQRRLEDLELLYKGTKKRERVWQSNVSIQLEYQFLKLHLALCHVADRVDLNTAQQLHERIDRIDAQVSRLNQHDVIMTVGSLPAVRPGMQAVFNGAARSLFAELKAATRWCWDLPSPQKSDGPVHELKRPVVAAPPAPPPARPV